MFGVTFAYESEYREIVRDFPELTKNAGQLRRESTQFNSSTNSERAREVMAKGLSQTDSIVSLDKADAVREIDGEFSLS